jgi:ribonuclease PH
VAKVKLGALVAKGLTVGVPCPAACKVTGTLTYKGKTVGSGHKTAIKAGTAKVRITLTKAGKKALRKARKAKLTLKVSMAPASGAKKTAKKTLTVKR